MDKLIVFKNVTFIVIITWSVHWYMHTCRYVIASTVSAEYAICTDWKPMHGLADWTTVSVSSQFIHLTALCNTSGLESSAAYFVKFTITVVWWWQIFPGFPPAMVCHSMNLKTVKSGHLPKQNQSRIDWTDFSTEDDIP